MDFYISKWIISEFCLKNLFSEDTTGPWQRTGVVGEGGLAHPDDTCGRALQLRWRTGSPWLLDCCDEEAGRSNPHQPLTSNTCILGSAWL